MSTKDKYTIPLTLDDRQAYIEQLKEEVDVRGLTDSTSLAYIKSINKFLDFYQNTDPQNMGLKEIKDFQRYLLKDKKYAPNTINRHITAIKFFYMNVLSRYEFGDLLPRVKVPKTIPIVLSEQEIARMIDIVQSSLWKAVLLTTYSAGLRQGEVRNLEVQDIDSDRMVIQVRNAKGQKSRQALLSPITLKALRNYWRIHRIGNEVESDFLFMPNKNDYKGKKIKKFSHTALHYIFKRAAELAGVKKKFIPIY